jgi:hypothetical protein
MLQMTPLKITAELPCDQPVAIQRAEVVTTAVAETAPATAARVKSRSRATEGAAS